MRGDERLQVDNQVVGKDVFFRWLKKKNKETGRQVAVYSYVGEHVVNTHDVKFAYSLPVVVLPLFALLKLLASCRFET